MKKLDKVKALGAKEGDVLGINYRTHPDWDEEAKKLTDGLGVDVVVNNVGVTAMEKSFNALRDFGGTIRLLASWAATWILTRCLTVSCPC